MRLKIRLKFLVDILLFLSGLISIATGLALLMLPSGPGTGGGFSSASSSLFDIASRGSLRLFHNWSSIIIIALIFFHLMLNWRIIICYFKNALRPAGSG